MPHSHHSHSGQFCKHAVGTLEEVVQEAINKRFELFGLTEHVPRYRKVDLYPEESELSLDALSEQFDKFLDEAHRLKSIYAHKISLLVGLETEYITDVDLTNLERILERWGGHIEYLVGSIHHVNGIPIDFDLPTYQQALASFTDAEEEDRQESLLSAYFDAQYELMQRFKPEIIGHFDLCRLYTPSLRFAEYPAVYEKIKRNIRYAVEYGALFEVNTAAFRKKWDTAYPAGDVVESTDFPHEIIHSLGGRFALSDDSHGPPAVGLNYHRLPEYLKAMGIAELWYLQKSATPNAAGRSTGAVKLEGQWSDHDFWRGRSL
ncbi:histidinol phosphate phosphatase H [Pholiota conissans]|uniref:Histidinol-phosphatase n=1 Tax=Pholiota conissans TaxID=109636 RepID=A0A9P5YUH2_9AGAR|nr:histidinol phosphate phosphatase H [Pholiota conissans]